MAIKKRRGAGKVQKLFKQEDKPATAQGGEIKMSTENGKGTGKLYQDQIYGPKVLTPLAFKLIDTPEFQRLAGIKQLGFANAAYRGAEHTRFAHSIGTYFISRTIMRRIVQNHERLGLDHPGKHLDKCFRVIPDGSYPPDINPDSIPISYQSRWRGLTEVVSIAALLHDITHIPFGHTLEDEFTGIYDRHDKLANPRLYQMFFHEDSEIRKVFCGSPSNWIEHLPNEELFKLIYLILSWKEKVEPKQSFKDLINEQLNISSGIVKRRLEMLHDWYEDFEGREMFYPFMSDVIANTICADLLDYLPRDRMNLGMEHRIHARIQRFLTIRPGTLFDKEGLRLSIMVTRPGRGGQRRDVATAVLEIMRERYEMAERVYYHHKKASLSAMLAKMVEICRSDAKPADDDNIYPASWASGEDRRPPHIVHLTDSSFIDCLGKAEVLEDYADLQKKLLLGLKYDRRKIYRTLLVVDTDLVSVSMHPINYFTTKLRGSVAERREVEKELTEAANEKEGEVLIYCPSSEMQSKEVDARLEINEKRILPLRVQRDKFTYNLDVQVLEHYYKDLWRMYIFVSPEVFDNPIACRAIVDKFCDMYNIPKASAYSKVRKHKFQIDGDMIQKFSKPSRLFLHSPGDGGLPFADTPMLIATKFLEKLETDKAYLNDIEIGNDPGPRLSSIFDVVILENNLTKIADGKKKKLIEQHIQRISLGEERLHLSRRSESSSFADYAKRLIETVTELQSDQSNDENQV